VPENPVDRRRILDQGEAAKRAELAITLSRTADADCFEIPTAQTA
jgi:hypothetical protein